MSKKDDLKFETIEIKAKTQPAKKLIVMLHGFGENAASLKNTADRIHKEIPEADILMVEGFYQVNLDDRTRKKYKISDKDILRSWIKGPINNAPMAGLRAIFNRSKEVRFFNKMLDVELKKRGLSSKDLGFFGFSMGGGLSLYISQARAEKCAFVVSHSGAYYGLQKPKSRPETLLIFGGRDKIIPLKAKASKRSLSKTFDRFRLSHETTKAVLKRNNVPTTEAIFPRLAHERSTETIKCASKFMRKKFGL
tara:strand:+ start:426 stop:1178 length:753 start_codon:yes stop_codon:yes gene_type:complete